ncbi:MAG: phage holin family protein [Syntrophorhabdaceae bacterium]|nr:phage holin family protein [Syntrophorhabdaceae bacterium]MDD4195917.1 phage holin family protein [Syntrophorhabdaceae bacterium]HOC45615.1 phage holin family protein [Syntrophorhabdaceae bacterium]
MIISMRLLLKWLVMTVAVLIAAYFIPGVRVASFFSALMVALFLGIVNLFLKPVLILITLPINILTLGLFTFVINAVLILLASYFVRGFQVAGFWWALLYGIVLSIVHYFLNVIVGPREN